VIPRIEIGRRHYLLYLLLSHPAKTALLSRESRSRLDAINRGFNEFRYSGEGAEDYDRIHGYAEALQHEYPARPLVEEVWARGGYGRVLELGGGTGYFTCRLAQRADHVVTVEPVGDMQKVLRSRCEAAGIDNVDVLGASAFDLDRHLPPASFDTAVVIQSVHHFHRRADVFAGLARLVRPGGRLLLLEPHHNVKRVARLSLKYLREYRAPSFWTKDANWATHDFLTRGELRGLCRRAGFGDLRINGYWLPYTRRLVPDPRRRFALERVLGRLPGVRHLASLLAVEARRLDTIP
jgi:ubiquinone/menaquinone biosynthesis C-methylase UbiE